MELVRFEKFEEIEDNLKRRKTFYKEPSYEDIQIKQFCPNDFDMEQLKKYEIKYKCLQKFNHDFSNRLRFNTLNLNFSESRIQTNKNDYLLWGNNEFNIIVPLRLPIGTKLIELSPGFISVQVSNVSSVDSMNLLLKKQNDNSSLLSSSIASNTMAAFLPEHLSVFCQQIRDFVRVLEVSNKTENKTIKTKLEFKSTYLTADLVTDNHSEESIKEGNKEKPIIEFIENKTETIIINATFIPALAVSAKFNNYLIPLSPIHQQYFDKYGDSLEHLWVEDHWWNENKILNKINNTDLKLRLKAAIGLHTLCKNDSDLNFLTETYFKHNLLTSFDSDLDDFSIKWQRKNLFSCFLEQLQHLKHQLQQKYFVHYFINDFNLLNFSRIRPESLRKAIEKLSLLISSKIMLLTAIGKNNEVKLKLDS